MMFLKGHLLRRKTHKMISSLSLFSKMFTLHVFLSNLPSKNGRSNVTYPVRVRDNAAERFDSPLHHLAGSQTSILIAPRI
jgi:hypothetical protein